MAEVLYTVHKQCPICNSQIEVTKVRSRLTVVQRDSDFCVHNRELNPYYYSIWVCNHCGYAAQDTYFNDISSAAVGKIKEFLAGRKVNINYSGQRTWQQAVETYKLAIFYAELIHSPPSRIAGLYLKLGWLFREAGNQELEIMALNKARENYEQALLKERMPIGNMSEVTLEYLIGELLRRTGRVEEALVYLGRLVSNPKARSEKKILEMAREAWQAARDSKQQIAATRQEATKVNEN